MGWLALLNAVIRDSTSHGPLIKSWSRNEYYTKHRSNSRHRVTSHGEPVFVVAPVKWPFSWANHNREPICTLGLVVLWPERINRAQVRSGFINCRAFVPLKPHPKKQVLGSCDWLFACGSYNAGFFHKIYQAGFLIRAGRHRWAPVQHMTQANLAWAMDHSSFVMNLCCDCRADYFLRILKLLFESLIGDLLAHCRIAWHQSRKPRLAIVVSH